MNKGYLLEIHSALKDNVKDTEQYAHTGIYCFEDLLHTVNLNLDSSKKINTTDGQVAEVQFHCSIIEDEELKIIFEPVFLHPTIINNFTNWAPTKEEAFMLAINNIKELIKLRKTYSYELEIELDVSTKKYKPEIIDLMYNKIKLMNPPCCGNKMISIKLLSPVINIFTLE